MRKGREGRGRIRFVKEGRLGGKGRKGKEK